MTNSVAFHYAPRRFAGGIGHIERLTDGTFRASFYGRRVVQSITANKRDAVAMLSAMAREFGR